MRPEVSILIPAYRAERYLQVALDSVAAQTYPNWEVRVHEDGVTDQTAAIVAAFSASHPGRVFHSATPINQGVSRSRNRLMDDAQGQIVAFLDADDTWAPDHLETALAAMERQSADWFVAGMQEIDATGGPTGKPGLPPQIPMSAIPAALLRHNFIPTTLAVLGPAAVARKARFDTALAVGEDLDLWLRLLQDGLKPVLSEKVTVHYRRHETNTTRDPIRFAEEFTKVFEKHLLNPSLPPGACLRGVEYMLRPAIRMTRFRQPHRALHSLFRIWRARQRFTGAPKSAID